MRTNLFKCRFLSRCHTYDAFIIWIMIVAFVMYFFYRLLDTFPNNMSYVRKHKVYQAPRGERWVCSSYLPDIISTKVNWVSIYVYLAHPCVFAVVVLRHPKKQSHAWPNRFPLCIGVDRCIYMYVYFCWLSGRYCAKNNNIHLHRCIHLIRGRDVQHNETKRLHQHGVCVLHRTNHTEHAEMKRAARCIVGLFFLFFGYIKILNKPLD